MVAQLGSQTTQFVEVCAHYFNVNIKVFLIQQFKLCSQCQDYVMSGLVSSSFLHCLCLNLHGFKTITKMHAK